MDLIGIALSIAITLVVVVAATVLVTAIRVSRVRLEPMRTESVPLAGVPVDTRSVLDAGRIWLLPRGFRYLSSWKIRPLIAKASEWKFCDVYARGDEGVFAIVYLREQPQPGDTTSIEFQSVFADGSVMSTCDRFGHTVVWAPPQWTIHDDCAGDQAAALDNHARRLQEHGGTPATDPGERDRISNALVDGYLEALVTHRKAHRAADGEVRIRFGAAVAYVIKLIKGNTRAAKVKVVPLVAETPAPEGAAVAGGEPHVAADLQAYFSRRATVASATGTGKWRLGLISAAAFIALGAYLWDWMFALLLLVVIAFHEGGHYLAMKWVGYRNLNVFFVPGLGGLATGEKQDATAAQKVVVYLAGPVPGIALATVGLLATPDTLTAAHPWLNQLMLIMLIVNVINLLPVTPLDGGRVLEVLLFMRWPRLRVAFALSSALVLAAAGAALGETVLLVIGLLVAMTLPAQWRFSKLARQVERQRGASLDERAAAQRVFATLAREPFRRWSFQHRTTAADELIAEMRTPIPGVAGASAGLALYAVCLFAPAAVALVASPTVRDTIAMLREAQELAPDPAEAQLAVAPARDWNAEFQRSRNAPRDQRLALLAEAAEAGFVSGAAGDEVAARAAEMRKLAGELPQGNVLRVRALRVIVDDREEPALQQATLRALLEELRDPGPEAAVERARVSAALAYTLDSSEERLRLLSESRDSLRDRAPAGDFGLATAWSELARERAQARDAAGAEREWLALIAWHESVVHRDAIAARSQEDARVGYASFLLQQARFDDAEVLLRPSVEAALAEAAATGRRHKLSMASWKLQTLFWIAARKGDRAAAARWLEGWERAAGERFARRNPQFGLARLAAADLVKDDKAAAEARAHLASLSGTASYLCRNKVRTYEGELQAHVDKLISRHGVCRAG